MPNAWVTHVKQYAAANNTSYGCAMTMPGCKADYKNKKEPTKESKKKRIQRNKRNKRYKSIYNVQKTYWPSKTSNTSCSTSTKKSTR